MLDYLLPYQKKIDWEELLKLKEERESWWERESSEKFKVGELPSLSNDPSPQEMAELEKVAMKLNPWKKGPFQIHGLEIDAEWRSDFKWKRIQESLLKEELEGKVVLDVGCNNGYFMFEMAKENPKLVLGFDPVLPMQAQFDFIQHYYQEPNVHFELFGVEHLNLFHEVFDTIFHMGIVYHHRHPIQQFLDIREALKPGGVVYLETIGIPGDESYALFPEDRYARMKNVWFVPTMSCFMNWATKARFVDVEIVADTDLTEDEQRPTRWCPPPFQSLKDSLDPEDPSLTIEGHPAPRRFLIKARKKGGRK
ncbi:MAG: tRNA 5-methoxyuridine(34)/uridine 5-oxyacetic acid(34) synthase CmoB [Halobacteriovoraceae bacterium]|nr:tRNA 5-methoxyuridine(34)/uridine 5-oxyacetic acid(34) synthase CmoB [Halobacteriovoraceae bacterium]